VDKLPEGYVHPCTVKEIKQKLKTLPPEHLEGLKRIRLAFRKSTPADAQYNEGTITIFAVPKNFIIRDAFDHKYVEEQKRFGARVKKVGRFHYETCWRPEDYKAYILNHVLLHEIGHHIDWYSDQHWQKRCEEFAENYAEGRLTNY
jgi:hypothetical protein